MFDYCVIMAGGSGTRLWPLSNSRKPKQFLPAPGDSGGRTFFDMALERAFSLVGGAGRVLVVAGKDHAPHVVTGCSSLVDGEKARVTVIPEPEAKNTAAAVLCAVAYIVKRADTPGADAKIFVLTSDHLIEPLDVFTKQALALADCAGRDALGVFGIPPLAPETGFGYIEAADAPDGNGGQAVASFHEKPNRETAERYLAAGNFFWNSGMFAFSARFMLDEFAARAPDIAAAFAELSAPDAGAFSRRSGVETLDNWTGLAAAYSRVRKISFDFAVVTKCERVVMAAAEFDWRDVGSWDEYAALDAGRSGAEHVFRIDSESSFVDSAIPVALCGADDLIVVVRSGAAPAVLIAKKGETQKVGALVELMKSAGRGDLL
jgi:mannose-1-phosphate guanylyltransferase/mannose-1-phosphate guanylyltransferase/mannose-6-phosphate isomerase